MGDNDGVLDQDPDVGEIKLFNVPLGKYNIVETAFSQDGWTLDPDTEMVTLTLANPSNEDGDPAIPVFVNVPPPDGRTVIGSLGRPPHRRVRPLHRVGRTGLARSAPHAGDRPMPRSRYSLESPT